MLFVKPQQAPASPVLGRPGVLLWVVWVLSVLLEKGVVWGFARLEGVLPEIPILKKVRKVPEVRSGGGKEGVEEALLAGGAGGQALTCPLFVPSLSRCARHLPRTRGRQDRFRFLRKETS